MRCDSVRVPSPSLVLILVSLARTSFAGEVPPPKPLSIAVGPVEPTVAVPPSSPVAVIPGERPNEFYLAGSLGSGALLFPGHTGAYGKASLDILFVLPQGRKFGWILGSQVGLEGWAGNAGGGFSLPMLAQGGFHQRQYFATVGLGLNAVTSDSIDKEPRIGFYSPRAEMRIGIRFGDVFLAAEAGAQYRWFVEFSDSDKARLSGARVFQLGFSLGFASHARSMH